MSALPKQYEWLLNEPAPKMIVFGLTLYGVAEIPGAASNPVILQWAQQLGIGKQYINDDTAWCGLVHAYIAMQCGKPVITNPLWALHWSRWGVPVREARLGTTLVFKRKGGGHVAQYVGEDREGYYHIMGGNQSNMYDIQRKAKSEIYAMREFYSIAPPANVRRIILEPTGEVFNNAA